MGLLSPIDLEELADFRTAIPVSCRRRLQDNDLGLVEDVYVSPYETPPSGHEANHQIVVPYHGFVAYCVGARRWHLDSNRLFLISPGWEFRDEHPVPNLGHGALVITPGAEILDEICREAGARTTAAFDAPSRATPVALRLLAHALRENALINDPLERDELLLRLLRKAVNGSALRFSRESPAVRRAKEILHSSASERLTLGHIAREVGVSSVYLTQEFTRTEGMPLYRYQRHLRLNRALAELVHCDDITGLALDLGFCSHSHFTSAFRSIFGMTPSQYRSAATAGELIRQIEPNSRLLASCSSASHQALMSQGKAHRERSHCHN